MDIRTNIAVYLAENFNRLYETKADVQQLFIDSLDPELDYFQLFSDIIKQPDPLVISAGNINFPVFYHHSTSTSKDIKELTDECLVANAFLVLSGWQEFVIEKRDQHERFPFNESLQFKFQFSLVPVVNMIFNEICRRINISGIPCVPLKFSAKGSNIVFSHDIDRLYSGWYEGTGNLVKHPGIGKMKKWLGVSYAKLIKGRDDYESGFCRLLDLLEKWNIRSVFFFLANKSTDDADYALSDPFIGKVKERLERADHLIGIHSGYFTFRDPVMMKTQLNDAEKAFTRKIFHNRQHFLRFDMAHTPELLVAAGIKYDFSLGFAESNGFRNGIGTPFSIFDFNHFKASELIEIPLFFMDGTYSHYQKVGKKDMRNPLESLAGNTEGLHLNFSVLFHNTVFTDFKYSGFTELFEQMTEYCKMNGFSTDAQLVWPDKSFTT